MLHNIEVLSKHAILGKKRKGREKEEEGRQGILKHSERRKMKRYLEEDREEEEVEEVYIYKQTEGRRG